LGESEGRGWVRLLGELEPEPGRESKSTHQFEINNTGNSNEGTGIQNTYIKIVPVRKGNGTKKVSIKLQKMFCFDYLKKEHNKFIINKATSYKNTGVTK
jgi:hypothetical protein